MPSKEVAKNMNCSEFEVDNWIISDFVVKKLCPIVGVHPFPISELSLMVSIVCFFKPSHIFEWGTHHGKSARIFFETIKEYKIDCEIHSIDLPEDIDHVEHPHQDRGKLVKGIREVNLHLGDGLNKSMEIYQGKSVKNRPLFFLDGDHSYQSVKRELEGIINEVPDAIILIHDTFFQSKESGYNVGPFEAINDILSKYPDKFKIISTKTGLPGMTLLYNELAES